MTVADYTAAPACALLATHCLFCNKPLLDAVSVERGIGPVCAKRNGAAEAPAAANWLVAAMAIEAAGLTAVLAPRLAAADARAAANAVVHAIGADAHAARVAHLVVALEALGFATLAAKVAEALRPVVRVTLEGDTLAVATERLAPEVFGPYVAALRAIRGRRWDAVRQVNVVPAAAKRALWAALEGTMPAGTVVIGTRLAVLGTRATN